MKHKERSRSAETVFALILLTLFTVLALFLVLIGGNAYRSTVARSERNTELRTTISYVANKVRACGKEAQLQTTDGVQVLVLRQRAENATYLTYIYEYDGYLFEFYGAETDVFSLADGEKLVKTAGLTFSRENGVLTIRAEQSSGRSEELCVRLIRDAE